MSMIRTHKRENPFVQLDKYFIGNGELSLKATGLLTYFLSKPDDWQIYMKDVEKRFKDGETSIRSAMNELMKNGYVYRWRERNEKGQLGSYNYEVYERPEFNPHLKEEKEDKPKDNKKPKKQSKSKGKKKTKSLDAQGISPKRENPVLENPVLDSPVLENQVLTNNKGTNNKGTNNKDTNNEYTNNLSILEKEIIQSNLPLPVQKALITNKDRLIDDNISLEDIELNYSANKGKVNEFQYAEVLQTVLIYTKNKIGNINGLMKTSIDAYLTYEKPENENKEPQHKEVVPDWFKERKHKQKKESSYSTDYSKYDFSQKKPDFMDDIDLEEERRKLQEMLDSYKRKSDKRGYSKERI